MDENLVAVKVLDRLLSEKVSKIAETAQRREILRTLARSWQDRLNSLELLPGNRSNHYQR